MAIGRLTIQKDYPTLFAAFRMVLRDHPQAKLLIAGDGPLGEDLEAAIADLGLRNDVALLGLRTDVRDLLQASDAYVMSSAWEGSRSPFSRQPQAAYQSLRRRLAGTPKWSWMALRAHRPPRDPAALASAMVAIMSSRRGAAPNSDRPVGVTCERRYGLDEVVETWITIYEGAMERKRPA